MGVLIRDAPCLSHGLALVTLRVVIQEDEVLRGELPIIRETGMRELLSEALKFVHLMI